MKCLKVVWVSVLLVSLAAVLPVQATLIWSNGFESGDFSAWTSASGQWDVVGSGGSAHTGDYGADITGSSTAPDDGVLTMNVSSENFQSLTLDYYYKIRESLESTDYVFVEWTASGTDWQLLKDYTDLPASTSWVQEILQLPAGAEDNSSFGFRLRAVLSSGSDRMNFDDFALTGVEIPEPATMLLGSAGLLAFRRRR